MVILQQQNTDGNPIVDSTVIIGEPATTTAKKSTSNQQKPNDSGTLTDKNNNNTEATGIEVENIDHDILVKSSSLDPLKSHPKKANPLITGLVTKEKAIATHSNLVGFSKEKEEKLRELYDFLDVNNDGTIDIRDLTAALKKKRYIPSRLAPEIFENMKREDHSTDVDFSDFLNYVMIHKKKLEEVFNQLDKNEDGLVDQREMQNYFHNLGIPITDKKAQSLVNIMDQTELGTVDLIEFKDFMILFPSTDLHDIAEFWRHNLVIDIGENSQIPKDFTPQEMQSGVTLIPKSSRIIQNVMTI